MLELRGGQVLVTAQNHSFAFGAGCGREFPSDFRAGARVTHVSLYDGTVEGLELR